MKKCEFYIINNLLNFDLNKLSGFSTPSKIKFFILIFLKKMNPLVAKRKAKYSINLEKDYFIFGLYPSNPSLFINHFGASMHDYSENSFHIKSKDQCQTIISHFTNENSQLIFLIFNCTDNKSNFIFQADDSNASTPEKEKYMKQIVQIKIAKKEFSPGTKELKIENIKLSSFSLKNEILVLSKVQYQYAYDLLKNLSEKKFAKLSFDYKQFNLQDICFIPAVVSHLHLKNQFEGPFLIISKSKNTVDSLFYLFNQWTFLRTLVLLGNNEELDILQRYVFPLVPEKMDIVKYHVVLTTQSVYGKSQLFFNSLTWNLIIYLDNQKSHLQKMESCSHFGISINGIIEY